MAAQPNHFGPQPNNGLAWNAPQLAPWPTIQAVATQPVQNGPPTVCCWRESGPGQADTRPGGWTPSSVQGVQPDLNGVSDVIMVFQRLSGPGTPNMHEYYAANALVGARIHDGLRLQGNGLPGRTLIICTTRHSHSATEPMPLRAPTPGTNQASWLMFIETMEPLDRLPQLPRVWFVSCSISSLSCAPGLGWANFWARYGNRWRHNLFVVYQVKADWPAPDAAPAIEAVNFVPWTFDPVFQIKFVGIPLAHLIGGGGPAWKVQILIETAEEYAARTMGCSQVRADQVRYGRGRNRLAV